MILLGTDVHARAIERVYNALAISLATLTVSKLGTHYLRTVPPRHRATATVVSFSFNPPSETPQ